MIPQEIAGEGEAEEALEHEHHGGQHRHLRQSHGRRLEQARAFLEERLELEEAKADFSRPVGIPLAALNWLVCPDCRESLVLESDQIRSGQIISGALTCPHCGRVLPVEDGILMVSPAPDAHKNFSSFDRFIDQTNQPLMQAISQSVRLMKSRVAKYQRPVRTFLDAGSGFGFFLRYTYDLIPDHSLYFAVDHNPMRHRFLKSVLASMPEQKNIALLCCDYGDIPLRSGSIDQIIDFGGSNDYSWIVPGFLMERLDWLTHEKSTALYLNRSYDRISFDSSIQPECRGYLYEEAILSNLKKLGYAIRERYRMDFTTPLQATNPFMNDRDQMYRLWLYLEKQR